MILYVDIDETICISPADRDYAKAKPIEKNIDKINKKLSKQDKCSIKWCQTCAHIT